MPAPIAISRNERYWIGIYLQETYVIRITDAYSCKLLSTEISNKSNRNISYSTIRRLFELVPNSNAFSRYVLNDLAFAVAFKDWDELKVHVLKFDTNVINQNIQIYLRKLPTANILIYETIKNIPIDTWVGAYQFQQIVSIAIQHRDFNLLSKIIKLPIDINSSSIYEHMVIGLQSFYFQSLKCDKGVIDFVQSNISSSILLQKCLLQAYVDEKYLTGFFGKWMEALKENSLPDLLLFKYLLLCQKSFIKNNIKLAQSYLESAFQESNKLQEIHPILKARFSVWSIILNANECKLENYFSSLINIFDKADFAVIASRLLWMYQNENEPLHILTQIAIEDFPKVKDFFQKGRYNVLILTISINYLLKKDIPKAKRYFNMFNTTDLAYDIVNIDFYLPWIEKLKSI
ncbi:hypothetical protein PQG46_06485 [Aquirufa nivalisilvae]